MLAERSIGHALVLGGAGFIGSAVLRALAAEGVRTTVLVHKREPGVRARAVTGTVDLFDWRALERDPPDAIFHLARIPGRSGLRGLVTRLRNRLASERLIDWLKAQVRPPLAVYVGGTLAYGSNGEALVTEVTPLAPVSFARDSFAAEAPWVRALGHGRPPAIVARPAWVLGPGSWFEAFYARPMREEGAVPLYGSGENWMSLVHVEDAGAYLVHAARRAPLFSCVNVATFPPLRQAELSERLARLSGLPVRRVPIEAVQARHGRAVREAFEFSARVGTVHGELFATFAPRHADLDAALAKLVSELRGRQDGR